MASTTINGKTYRIPVTLSDFQRDMYVHLIEWKWKQGMKGPGFSGGNPYDAVLSDADAKRRPHLYKSIPQALDEHNKQYPFRIHKHFNHMASSQAANLNLFLPVLMHSRSSEVLRAIKPDFARLATEKLYRGYRIEFWDEESGEPKGNLGDKAKTTGTDCDMAIAYYNDSSQLCLWLIEHKLTEKEFTECGGFKSKGRLEKHDCSKCFSAILADMSACYYHDKRKFNYWKITERNKTFFPNHGTHTVCPFRGGMNQLWRNQLLAMSVERDPKQPYQRAFFSVVKHPRNLALDHTLNEYIQLTGGNPAFSVFTSADVVQAASGLGDGDMDSWVAWYRELYDL